MATAKDIRNIEMEGRDAALGVALYRSINTRVITGTAETSQFPTSGRGSLIITPEDWSETGKTIYICGFGNITTTTNAGQGTIRLKIGATTILLNQANFPTQAITDGIIEFSLFITLTGTNSVRVSGKSTLETTSGGGRLIIRALNTATDQTITTNANQTLDYTYQFQNTGNTLTIRDIKVIRL